MSETPSLDPAVVRWSAPAAERADRPTIVVAHGYGADENDLFGLIPYLPEEYVYAAVRAQLAPPWPSPGYSWYPIEGLSDRSPDRITDGATRLLEWIDSAGIGRVGLLGFSQGGAISLQAMRLAPERFDFIVNLSGYVAEGEMPGDGALRVRRPPVFWGRGSDDQVIPEPLIAHTTEWLPGYTDLSGRVYPNLAHAVSLEEIGDIRTFLLKHLEPQAPTAA